MPHRRRALHILAALAFAAASLPGPAAAVEPIELSGRTWDWASYASAFEEMKVDVPEHYTLTFAGGRVALRADCNRATATVIFAGAGKLAMGPVAMTRAKCPDSSLSERFARYVGRATGYSLKHGALYLDLDGGQGTLRFTLAK